MAGRDLIFTILGIDKASPAFDKVGRAAERAGDRLDKVGNVAVKTMAATTAASVAGGLATAAAIGGVPLLFAGMAAAALASNEQVAGSFRSLADRVGDDAKAMAAPLQDDLVGVAHDLERAWTDVTPLMHSALADPALGKGVRELSAGVGDLARNAMPGLVESVRRSEPVMAGFRSLMGDVGTGTSDLLRNVARESESSGVVIEGFGRITRTVLGDVGGLLAELSATAAPHMGQLSTLVEQATGSVLGLASGALPVLSSAGGAAAGMLSGVLGVLEPISAQLGTGVGLALAAAGGWRVLSAASGAYTKLDLPGRLSAGGLAAGVFTEGLTGSANAGERVATAGSKVGRVLGGLGAALPYVGIGVAALGLAFEAAGRSAEELAQRAETNATNLLKGGAAADQTRKHLADLEAANRSLNAEMEALAGRGDDQSEAISRLNFRIKENREEISQTSVLYEEQKAKLTGAQLAQVAYNEAVERYGTDSAQAAAAGAAWRAALDADKAKADAAAVATQTYTDRLAEHQEQVLGAINAGLAHATSIQAVADRQKELNDAVTKWGTDSPQAAQASRDLQAAQLAQATAAGQAAAAAYTGTDAQERLRLQSNATTLELLAMAAASNGNLTPALQSAIGQLGATDLAAAGAAVRVNSLGQAVITLPDGKTVTIQADTAAAQGRIDSFIRDNDGRVIHITTEVSTGVSSNKTGGGMDWKNSGGWVPGGGPDRDSVPTMLTPKEFVVNRKAAAKHGPLLEAINTAAGGTVQMPALPGAARPGPGGPGPAAPPDRPGSTVVHRHNHLTVMQAGNSVIDLLDQFDRMQALDDLA